MRKQKTYLNECRKFFPTCTPLEAKDLFWTATAYPFAPIGFCRQQLREASKLSDRDAGIALIWASEQWDKAMEEKCSG